MEGIPVLFEDNHLLVVVKPRNLPTQADATGDPDLLTRLKEYVRDRYRKPGGVYLGIVHRLDRPVAGVMVFARTSKAASRLSDQIRRRVLDKVYLAVVRGEPPERGELVHHLKKDRERNTVRVVDAREPGARRSRLRYRVLETRGSTSLVRVELVTGRSHQVRVQLAAIGHPLVGDGKYGGRRGATSRLGLFCHALAFDHPTRSERCRFEAKPDASPPWSPFPALS